MYASEILIRWKYCQLWQVRRNYHTLQCDRHLGMMTSHNTTSSQCNWPVWSVEQERVLEDTCIYADAPVSFNPDHTGSHLASQCFRSCDLLAAKIESFGRRVRDLSSAGGADLVAAACAAYNRWSTAVETDRLSGRAAGFSHTGQPHHEELFDEVHGRLVDILDAALDTHSATSVRDLATALSVTVVDAAPNSDMSLVDIETLLQRVKTSLQKSLQQVGVYSIL